MPTSCKYCKKAANRLWLSSFRHPSLITQRALSSTASQNAETVKVQGPPGVDPGTLDPSLVITRGQENALRREKGLLPIGSRRRRVLASQHSDQTPFEQMPYQCFQEARKVLAADREEKLLQIAEMRRRIARAQEIPVEKLGGEYIKRGKIVRMQKHLEELKILADINDPLIKKKFEDGLGESSPCCAGLSSCVLLLHLGDFLRLIHRG